MESNTGHILTQRGILTSFSVAKKITESDINNFFTKYKKRGKSEEEIGELLRQKLFEEIRDALVNKKIPGILNQTNNNILKPEKINQENLLELNKSIMVIANALTTKKYDKLSLCYFINSLVNVLGLSEKDFETFHKRMQNENDEEGEGEGDSFA